MADLPVALLCAVLAALGPRDRARASAVCRSWRAAVGGLRSSPYRTVALAQTEAMRANDTPLFRGFSALALDPHGELLVGFDLEAISVAVWSMTTAACLHVWPMPFAWFDAFSSWETPEMYDVRFYGSRNVLFGACFTYMAMDVRTGAVLFRAQPCHDQPTVFLETAASFCPSGDDVFRARFAVGYHDGSIAAFDVGHVMEEEEEEEVEVRRLRQRWKVAGQGAAVDGVYELRYAPDGARLAAVLARRVCVWSVASDAPVALASLADDEQAYMMLRWSADSARIAVVDSDAVRIFDAVTGAPLTSVAVDNVTSMDWCADGSFLLAERDDAVSSVVRRGPPGPACTVVWRDGDPETRIGRAFCLPGGDAALVVTPMNAFVQRWDEPIVATLDRARDWIQVADYLRRR